MSSTQTLSAASQDRKARLAQLSSLKRKQPPTTAEDDESQPTPAKSPRLNPSEDKTPAAEEDVTTKYLSGRNYDPTIKGARLGFENAPSANVASTLESQAEALALETKQKAEAEAKEDKPLDLFKLQPKKPNWDLKRDLERKLEVLNVRTDNAIARIVRERIKAQQAKAKEGVNGSSDGEAVGMEGAALVEATNVREREDEEEARREREEIDELGEGNET